MSKLKRKRKEEAPTPPRIDPPSRSNVETIELSSGSDEEEERRHTPKKTKLEGGQHLNGTNKTNVSATAMAKVSKNPNGKGVETSDNCNGSSSSAAPIPTFKAPAPPPPKAKDVENQAMPPPPVPVRPTSSSSRRETAKSSTSTVVRKRQRGSGSSTNSAKIRKAFVVTCFAILEELHKEELNTDDVILPQLLSNLQACIKKFSNVFAPQSFSNKRHQGDYAKTSEVLEFAQWWFFTLTVLLFSYDKEEQHHLDIKQTFRIICALVSNGYPNLLEEFTPQLLKILGALTYLPIGQDTEVTLYITGVVKDEENENELTEVSLPKVDAVINGQRPPPPPKEHFFRIKIPQRRKWAIPHFLQAISNLLPDIFYNDLLHRHVLLDLLKRLLWTSSVEGMGQVASCLTACWMPNISYLTEDVFISSVKKILQGCCLGTEEMSPAEVNNRLRQFDLVLNSNYSSFLEDTGLMLLRKGILKFFTSPQCMKQIKSGSYEVLTDAIRPLLKDYVDNAEATKEMIKFTKLMSLMGLDAVLYPFLEYLVISQLKLEKLKKLKADSEKIAAGNMAHSSERKSQSALLSPPPLEVWTYSRLWQTILESWESKLTHSLEDENIEGPDKNLEFLQRTAQLMKLALKVYHEMASEDGTTKWIFFKATQVAKWIDLVKRSLKSLAKSAQSKPDTIAMLSAILDSIQYLDKSMSLQLKFVVYKTFFEICGLPWMHLYPAKISKKGLLNIFSFAERAFLLKEMTDSPLIYTKAVRCLRLDCFRPWKFFVVEVYSKLMSSSYKVESLKDELVLIELLRTFSEVSWAVQETGVRATLRFFMHLAQGDLWKFDVRVRNNMVEAILALPCVLSFSVRSLGDSEATKRSKQVLKLRNGCEICSPPKTPSEINLRRCGLPEPILRKIVHVVTPLLYSPFLLTKHRLSELIIRCNSHVIKPEDILVVGAPQVEMSLYGNVIVCQEVFRKVGALLVENNPEMLEYANPIHQEISMKLFRLVIPYSLKGLTADMPGMRVMEGKEGVPRKRLTLKTRSKLLSGILEMTKVGPMSLCVFVEVMHIILLILSVTSIQDSSLTIHCKNIIQEFADFHKCTPVELVCRVRSEIGRRFVNVLLRSKCLKKLAEPLAPGKRFNVMKDIIHFLDILRFIWGFNKGVNFDNYFFPPILDHVVHRLHTDSRYELILAALAESHCHKGRDKKTDTKKISELLQDYVMFYFPKLLMDYGREITGIFLTFILTKYGFDCLYLAKLHEQRILNEALSRFDDRSERVLQHLKNLCHMKDNFSNSEFFISEGTGSSSSASGKPTRLEIQKLLDKRVLGFIIYFDTKMISRIETVEVKKKILRSFAVLLKKMGKHNMSGFRSKVYKSLVSVMELGPECRLYEEVLKVWTQYSANLDDYNMAAMASQIIAALLKLKEDPRLGDKVDALISSLVCFRKAVTEPAHTELFFLEDQCSDPEVVNTIKQALSPLDFFHRFKVYMASAENENYYVRWQALLKLKEVLSKESENVEMYVLSRGDNTASQLITILLKGLRLGGNKEDNSKIRVLILECFGLLGALDSGKFCKREDEISKKRSTALYHSCDFPMFCILYLKELIREFLEAKDTASFDYCACLISTVLVEMKVQQREDDKTWNSLTSEEKMEIMPLMMRQDYLKYRMGAEKPITYPCPIYLSEFGKNFDDWLTNWLGVLISFINQDEQKTIHTIFTKSKPLLRMNPRISEFVAPFIAMYAIFSANSDQQKIIVKEIMTIVERCTVLEQRKTRSHSLPVRDIDLEQGVFEEPEMSLEFETAFHSRCTQVILALLDHLLRASDNARRKWGYRNVRERENDRKLSPSLGLPPMTQKNLKDVLEVLHKIPKGKISMVAFEYEFYTTALFYLEQEVEENGGTEFREEELKKNLGYFQRIYISLGDMDSVWGVGSIQTEPCDRERALESIANGDGKGTVKILEEMVEKDGKSFTVRNALVQAYLNVEEPQKADVFIKAALQEKPEWEFAFHEAQADALLRLRKWDQLETYVVRLEGVLETNEVVAQRIFDWRVAVPRILLKAKKGQFEKAMDILEQLKMEIVTPMVTASEDLYPYKRAYTNVVQLHVLVELEEGIKMLSKITSKSKVKGTQQELLKDIKGLVSRWDSRLQNVCKSKRVVDEILKVRKAVFEIMRSVSQEGVRRQLDTAICNCWLEMARDASKLKNFILADNCLAKAKHSGKSSRVMFEEAKILSRKGDKLRAVCTIDKAISQYFAPSTREKWKTPGKQSSSSSSSTQDNVNRVLCAKVLLLETKLKEELKQLNREQYIKKYLETTEIHKESEKNFFTLGSYYDRVWSQADKATSPPEKWFDVQAAIVKNYAQSLFYGCKYVYQSLPRLLSIWFDYAALNTADGTTSKSYPVNFDRMQEYIKRMKDTIPAFILMTAFSQLVSRLCHSNDRTWHLLRDIIVSLMKKHPHQTLWMTIAIYKSVNKARKIRCNEIYDKVKREKPELKNVIVDYACFAEKLIGICERKAEHGKYTLANLCPPFAEFVLKLNKVLIPFQTYLSPVMPHKGVHQKDHDPFPETAVYIHKVEEEVTVMASLARPKKITFIATNGKKYGVLCKPKDDLRKDSKVMEVNSVVNWYLSQNSECSQRRLHVRTYAVVPLNEVCGLLEWVPNLTGLRIILLNTYRERTDVNRDWNMKKIRDMKVHWPVEDKKNLLLKTLPHCPPVLAEWFFKNFSDHQSWFAARTAYTRTAAVMSMVGYVMGLGDRHGENILLDSETGETVHVDFNCIFNKGETFEWPEMVPFRMTHNMVHAMGPLGIRGVFTKSCEIVMETFRERKAIFLSVLRPFVFDPLVEWDKEDNRVKPSSRTNTTNLVNLESGERTCSKAVETMSYIMRRLNGTGRVMLKDKDSELSVKALVQYLINEATDIENLCQMFPGWCSNW